MPIARQLSRTAPSRQLFLGWQSLIRHSVAWILLEDATCSPRLHSGALPVFRFVEEEPSNTLQYRAYLDRPKILGLQLTELG